MRFLLIFPLLLVFDLLRSIFVIRQLSESFHRTYTPQPELYRIGKGDEFHIALLGDSAIDGNRKNKLKFGPAESLVDALAKKYTVTIHVFAVQGSKSYDVIENQLPKVKTLRKIDILFVYMGANNVIRGERPLRMKNDFVTLLNFAASKNLPVVSSEIASYWQLTMFSWVHRFIIYICNTSANRQIRALTRQYNDFTLERLDWMTRKYLEPAYFADRLHPSDTLNRVWADHILENAKKNAAVEALL